MKERPILFSGPMVRALLAGTKTQTRRVVKPQPQMVTDARTQKWEGNPAVLMQLMEQSGRRCPYGQPGDRLWVRETWAHTDGVGLSGGVLYRADFGDGHRPIKYRPSIHMPRWASRITLEITAVRVERLQDIGEADAIAEGATFHDGRGIGHSGYRHDGDDGFIWATAKASYMRLWESINGPGSWDANQWVWVVEFSRVTP